MVLFCSLDCWFWIYCGYGLRLLRLVDVGFTLDFWVLEFVIVLVLPLGFVWVCGVVDLVGVVFV